MKPVTITTTIEKRPIVPVSLPARPPLWMIQEDPVLFGKIRDCAPCPAVVILKDDPHAAFDKYWQFAQRAWNYNIPLRYISPNYGTTLAFFNRTGFPGHHNWITGDDADQPNPRADKVRSCVRNVITGEPSYSLLQALKDTVTLAMSLVSNRPSVASFRKSFAAVITQNVLKVQTFDSRQPPPLKPGRAQPERVEDIDIDDYEITPRTHRWLFVVENIVNKSGLVKPFDHGALYDWMADGNYYTFLPLISNHGYGDVLYPLAKLLRIGPDAPIPSPYRFA